MVQRVPNNSSALLRPRPPRTFGDTSQFRCQKLRAMQLVGRRPKLALLCIGPATDDQFVVGTLRHRIAAASHRQL